MGVSPKQVFDAIDWNDLWRYEADPSIAAGWVGDQDIMMIKHGSGCTHETCYETHYEVSVFQVGEQFFGRNAEYSSFAGLEWAQDRMFEVKPVQRTVTEFITPR